MAHVLAQAIPSQTKINNYPPSNPLLKIFNLHILNKLIPVPSTTNRSLGSNISSRINFRQTEEIDSYEKIKTFKSLVEEEIKPFHNPAHIRWTQKINKLTLTLKIEKETIPNLFKWQRYNNNRQTIYFDYLHHIQWIWNASENQLDKLEGIIQNMKIDLQDYSPIDITSNSNGQTYIIDALIDGEKDITNCSSLRDANCRIIVNKWIPYEDRFNKKNDQTTYYPSPTSSDTTTSNLIPTPHHTNSTPSTNSTPTPVTHQTNTSTTNSNIIPTTDKSDTNTSSLDQNNTPPNQSTTPPPSPSPNNITPNTNKLNVTKFYNNILKQKGDEQIIFFDKLTQTPYTDSDPHFNIGLANQLLDEQSSEEQSSDDEQNYITNYHYETSSENEYETETSNSSMDSSCNTSLISNHQTVNSITPPSLPNPHNDTQILIKETDINSPHDPPQSDSNSINNTPTLIPIPNKMIDLQSKPIPSQKPTKVFAPIINNTTTRKNNTTSTNTAITTHPLKQQPITKVTPFAKTQSAITSFFK